MCPLFLWVCFFFFFWNSTYKGHQTVFVFLYKTYQIYFFIKILFSLEYYKFLNSCSFAFKYTKLLHIWCMYFIKEHSQFIQPILCDNGIIHFLCICYKSRTTLLLGSYQLGQLRIRRMNHFISSSFFPSLMLFLSLCRSRFLIDTNFLLTEELLLTYISCKASLVEMNSLWFYLSEKVLLLQFWKINALYIEYYISGVFFHQEKI